jgi:hypothetical protein
MLTVIRWSLRDTYNYKGDFLEVRKPLIIISDIIAVTINSSKSTITPSLNVILKASDLNYASAITPGDFVLVNMVNDETLIWKGNTSDNTLLNRANKLQSINRFEDGFKGLFKVQSCRKRIITNPETGVKFLGYQLVAYGFTEFNNVIYYDPQVFNQFNGNYKIFMAQFDKLWSNIVSGKNNFSIQTLMQLLIKTLLGQGLREPESKLPTPFARHFKAPKGLGNLMGTNNAQYVCELYNYVFGIWKKSSIQGVNPKNGFNPSIVKDLGTGFYKTGIDLDGQKVVAAEFWNNVKVWAILQNYLNPVINEMYTTYRVDISGLVKPTLIVRQKPFTSLHFKGEGPITKYLEMPRWRISPTLIYSVDLGKDETNRINFVQIKTRSLAVNVSKDLAMQTGLGNWVADEKDISRNGLRPFVATANYDYPEQSKKTKGKKWAHIVADWLFAGHLRESGSIETVGIEEPIGVGDNLELDRVVYHIENMIHSMVINADGKKIFRSQFSLSFGMDDRSTSTKPIYPESDYSSIDTKLKADYNGDRLLPGLSESQDTPGRTSGEVVSKDKADIDSLENVTESGTFTNKPDISAILEREGIDDKKGITNDPIQKGHDYTNRI